MSTEVAEELNGDDIEQNIDENDQPEDGNKKKITMKKDKQRKEEEEKDKKRKEEEEAKDQIIVETINILVSTNIPNEKDISLTSKVLVGTSPNSVKYNEYPYITSTIKFKEVFLLNKSRNDILDFFFIKDIFLKTANSMYAATAKKTEVPRPEEPKDDEDDDDNEVIDETKADKANKREKWAEEAAKWDQENENKIRDRTIKNLNDNIEIMIRILFDTYPIIGNVMDTLKSDYITKTYNVNKYAYLNINSKDYTMSKVIWINDIYNHYISKQFIKDFKEFNAWKTGEIRNITNSIDDNNTQRIIIIDDIKESRAAKAGFSDDIIKIENYLFNLSNWMNNTQSLMTIRNAMEILYAHLVILRNEFKNTAVEKKRKFLLEKKKFWLEKKSEYEKNAIARKKNSTHDDQEEEGTTGGAARDYNREVSDSDYTDMITRIGNIDNIFIKSKDKKYNLMYSNEFMIELNRVANIVIGSNLVPLTNTVQTTIKDLNENNQKRISLENDKRYIENEKIILGNDKYKNSNFKTLSDAFMKNVQLIKKVSNYKYCKEFNYEKMKELIKKLQYPSSRDAEEDAFGIIYDNNNVTTPKYGIYMYIDLTEGKITDANKNNIDLCSFRDELLLIKFNQLRNNGSYILQHDPLIKMLPVEPQKQASIEPQKQASIEPQKQTAVGPQKGGRLTYKVYRTSNNNKTKKNMK
jgi:hypothetical protein